MPDDALSDDDVALAGELALGVLEGDERAAALRRVLAEPGFAAEVEAWRMRLAPLLDDIAEVPPPEGVWNAIERTLVAGNGGAVTRWRVATAAFAAMAAALALVLVTRNPIPTPAPPPAPTRELVAQLVDAKGAPLLVAHYDATVGALRVRTSNLPQGALRPELWVIGGDAKPHSLGLVALNAASAVGLPPGERARIVPDATFALTMEPSAGAPHAAPSGAILGTAKLALL